MKITFEVADEEVARVLAPLLAAVKPATKTTKAADKPADKPADKTAETAPKADRDGALKALQAYSKAHGREAAMAVLKQFAGTLAEVADDDVAPLIEALNKAPEAAGDGF